MLLLNQPRSLKQRHSSGGGGLALYLVPCLAVYLLETAFLEGSLFEVDASLIKA